MSRLRHSIQIESRFLFSVLKFTCLQNVPVAESSGPIGGKYSKVFPTTWCDRLVQRSHKHVKLGNGLCPWSPSAYHDLIAQKTYASINLVDLATIFIDQVRGLFSFSINISMTSFAVLPPLKNMLRRPCIKWFLIKLCRSILCGISKTKKDQAIATYTPFEKKTCLCLLCHFWQSRCTWYSAWCCNTDYIRKPSPLSINHHAQSKRKTLVSEIIECN